MRNLKNRITLPNTGVLFGLIPTQIYEVPIDNQRRNLSYKVITNMIMYGYMYEITPEK